MDSRIAAIWSALKSASASFSFDPLPVVVNLLGLLFQASRPVEAASGSGREDRDRPGQILLADGLVPFQRQNEIGRFGGIVRRAEDFVFVALERSDPGVDVSGVLLGIVRDSRSRGEENAGQFCSKLLLCIVRVAETIRIVSVDRSSRDGWPVQCANSCSAVP